jgi:hypothetical protein
LYIIIVTYKNKIQFQGGDWALKSPTFAVVNDIAHVANVLPRKSCDPSIAMILKRAGSKSKKELQFRPAKVNAAVQWLIQNNPHYIEAINKKELTFEPLESKGDEELFEDLPVHFPFSEVENADVCQALEDIGSAQSSGQTSESEIILLYTEKSLLSREDHIRTNLGAHEETNIESSEKELEFQDPLLSASATVSNATSADGNIFYLPRINKCVRPMDDEHFYEKAFPHLFPYGGGGFGRMHGKRESSMIDLVLRRGGDRRFGQDARFYFATYTYKMRKHAGGVAMIASKKFSETVVMTDVLQGTDTHEKADEDALASSPTVAVGVRHGNVFSEISECVTAEDVLKTLQKNNGASTSELMKRLEPYSASLPGTPMFINHERKLLYSMMASPDVAREKDDLKSSRMLSIFGTNSPCDRFNPELFDLVRPIPRLKDESTHAWNSRRVALRNFEPRQSDESEAEWIARCNALHDTQKFVEQGKESAEFISKSQRTAILRQFPALAARIADARFACMFQHIYQGEAKPFGDVSDFWYRVEFQVQLYSPPPTRFSFGPLLIQ